MPVLPGAGSLRTRVRIDSQVRTPDSQGGYALTWTAVLSTHAERIDLSGSEQLRAAQVSANQLRRYRIRRPPSTAIDETMRLVDIATGETFNIRNGSSPDQKRRWLILQCEFIPGSSGA